MDLEVQQGGTLGYKDYMLRITKHKSVEVMRGCNGWSAKNIGTNVVTVNGVPLQPPPSPGLSGESYGLFGNTGELYTAPYIEVVFSSNTGSEVIIVQKVYDVKMGGL